MRFLHVALALSLSAAAFGRRDEDEPVPGRLLSHYPSHSTCATGERTANCIGLLSGCCANWLNENPLFGLHEQGWYAPPVAEWIRPQVPLTGPTQTFAAVFTISSEADVKCAKLELSIAVDDELASIELNDAPIPIAPQYAVNNATLTPVDIVAATPGMFMLGLNVLRVNVTNNYGKTAAMFASGRVQLLCPLRETGAAPLEPWLGPVVTAARLEPRDVRSA